MKFTRDCAVIGCNGFFLVEANNGRRKYCNACLSNDWHAQNRKGDASWRRENKQRAREWRARNQDRIKAYRAAQSA